VRKYYFLILVFYGLVYLLPLSFRPLIIPDETRYAEISREMIVTGDWLTPHLNGLRYFEKPIMGYWCNALSMLLFGQNAFAARFPSALAVGITALMIFLLVRRALSRESVALLAAFIFLSSLEIYGIGTFNVLDNVFSMFLTLTLVVFYSACQETQKRKRMGLLALCGFFSGLAFLTKGFLAFVIPTLIIIPFLIREARWKDLYRIPWIPFGAALLVVMPWAVVIHLREPGFWHYFFWVEHVQRFMSHHPQHPESFWYFIPVLFIGALPWSALVPAAVKGISQTHYQDPFLRFTFYWFLFPFIFFSISQGKLLTYILPCFPPLAILLAFGLVKYFETGREKTFKQTAFFLAMLLGIIVLGLAVGQAVYFFKGQATGLLENRLWMVLSISLLVGGLFFFLAARGKMQWQRVGCFGIALLFFMLGGSFSLPCAIKENKAPEAFLRQQAGRVQSDTILVTDEELTSAVCWTYRRSDVYLLERGGEFSYGLKYPDSKQGFLTIPVFQALVDRGGKNQLVTLIATADFYQFFKSAIPKPRFERQYGRFIFAQF